MGLSQGMSGLIGPSQGMGGLMGPSQGMGGHSVSWLEGQGRGRERAMEREHELWTPMVRTR